MVKKKKQLQLADSGCLSIGFKLASWQFRGEERNQSGSGGYTTACMCLTTTKLDIPPFWRLERPIVTRPAQHQPSLPLLDIDTCRNLRPASILTLPSWKPACSGYRWAIFLHILIFKQTFEWNISIQPNCVSFLRKTRGLASKLFQQG